MSLRNKLSKIAMSNLYTMEICTNHDFRQKVGIPYKMPEEETRELRAKLIMEEALETIMALGFTIVANVPLHATGVQIVDLPKAKPSLENVIDGCCDLIYVATGCLLSCGVPDLPHLQLVCDANNAKFPDGKVVMSEYGKYLKPVGWKPPNHMQLLARQTVDGTVLDLQATAKDVVFMGHPEDMPQW